MDEMAYQDNSNYYQICLLEHRKPSLNKGTYLPIAEKIDTDREAEVTTLPNVPCLPKAVFSKLLTPSHRSDCLLPGLFFIIID